MRNVTELDLYNYGLTVLSYAEVNDSSQIPALQFTIKLGSLSDDCDVEQLFKDMEIMNTVRKNHNTPAIKEAYEQLLTVLALSK